MKKSTLAVLLVSVLCTSVGKAQCIQFVNYPADTTGWVHYSDHPGNAFYTNDTFTITTSAGGENNYLYNSFPTTLFGTASEFSVSFDFRMDELNSCSDGLSFWFLSSSLYQLGSTSNEGCALGFPDTVSGFTLAMQTTVCWNNIYLKKINSTGFSMCHSYDSSTSAGDTNICVPLSGQMFLTDSQWHHCIINYINGYITASFDAGYVVMSGYAPIYGTGHFGFMATNGGGYTRKCLKNIQICAGYGTPTAASDSFGTYVTRLCNGPQIEVHAKTYNPSYRVTTYFGDGTNNTSSFLSDPMGGGYVNLSHTYQSAGDYTVREKLLNGTTPIDSLHFDYENVFCATLPVKFYYDANSDCLKESNEPYIALPILTEVDSDGIPVDTVSATGGFYYNVQGTVGTIYSFKVLSVPGNMSVSCPSTGVVYDSLVSGIFIYPIKYVALTCVTGSAYDLAVNSVIPVTGIHDEWGDVYVDNAYCASTNGTLTLHYSAKYSGTPSQVSPTPTTVSGDSIVWDISSLTSVSPGNTHLHYQVNYGTSTLTVGDTVHSYFALTPTAGDADPTNNYQIIIDTVKAGCDPNEMSVTPAGCIQQTPGLTQLQYTISFNNVGNDTAFNIYVMDTLPYYVEPKSLRIIMASNNMNTAVFSDGPYNIAKFIFPQINLVDSATCPQCNGGLIFNINTAVGLPIGTTLFNHAGIFFDDNPVVLTNYVENIVGNCPSLGVTVVKKEDNLQIYPNPTTGELTIQTTQGAYSSFTITNTIGQTMLQQPLNGAVTNVNVSMLPSGVYYITLRGESGSTVQKVVKW